MQIESHLTARSPRTTARNLEGTFPEGFGKHRRKRRHLGFCRRKCDLGIRDFHGCVDSAHDCIYLMEFRDTCRDWTRESPPRPSNLQIHFCRAVGGHHARGDAGHARELHELSDLGIASQAEAIPLPVDPSLQPYWRRAAQLHSKWAER